MPSPPTAVLSQRASPATLGWLEGQALAPSAPSLRPGTLPHSPVGRAVGFAHGVGQLAAVGA